MDETTWRQTLGTGTPPRQGLAAAAALGNAGHRGAPWEQSARSTTDVESDGWSGGGGRGAGEGVRGRGPEEGWYAQVPEGSAASSPAMGSAFK